jgi:hypothetical protein
MRRRWSVHGYTRTVVRVVEAKWTATPDMLVGELRHCPQPHTAMKKAANRNVKVSHGATENGP